MGTAMKTAAVMLAYLALCGPTAPAPPEAIEYRPRIELDGERDTREWDERRWVAFIYRRIAGDSSYKDTYTGVTTATGHVVDLFEDEEIAWEIAFDHDWRTALSGALLGAIGLEAEPGVWLLIPDARRSHYLECQVVVQHLRQYGVPMHVQTLTIPER